jgi:hypothetical protein
MKYQCSKCGETENLHYNYDYNQQHRPVIDVICNSCENVFDGNIPVADLTKNDGIKQLGLHQGLSAVSKTFGPEDEPIAVRILRSGWVEFYHVLVEYGDYETTDYHFLSAEQILEKYDIDIEKAETAILVDNRMIKEYPNAQDLGNEIRKEYLRNNQ